MVEIKTYYPRLRDYWFHHYFLEREKPGGAWTFLELTADCLSGRWDYCRRRMEDAA